MVVVERNCRARLGAAAFHERGVNDNAREPRRELRPPLEALEVAVRGEQSILQSVLGILGIPEHTERGLEQRAVVAAEKRLNRLSISALTRADQPLFAKLRRAYHLRCHCSPQCRLVRVN
jgi:hypothetical protein